MRLITKLRVAYKVAWVCSAFMLGFAAYTIPNYTLSATYASISFAFFLVSTGIQAAFTMLKIQATSLLWHTHISKGDSVDQNLYDATINGELPVDKMWKDLRNQRKKL